MAVWRTVTNTKVAGKLLKLGAIPLLSYFVVGVAGCYIGKTKLFDAGGKDIPLGQSLWSIGIPLLRGYMHVPGGDRSDSVYRPWVPLSYNNRWAGERLLKREVWIDSVTILLFDSGRRVTCCIWTGESEEDGEVHPIVGYLSHYKGAAQCLVFQPLLVPSSEDSVRIEFDVKVLQSDGKTYTSIPYSFVLKRHDWVDIGGYGWK